MHKYWVSLSHGSENIKPRPQALPSPALLLYAMKSLGTRLGNIFMNSVLEAVNILFIEVSSFLTGTE